MKGTETRERERKREREGKKDRGRLRETRRWVLSQGPYLALLPNSFQFIHGYGQDNTWRLQQPAVTQRVLEGGREGGREDNYLCVCQTGKLVLTVGQHILRRLRAFPAVRNAVESWRRNSGVHGDEAV